MRGYSWAAVMSAGLMGVALFVALGGESAKELNLSVVLALCAVASAMLALRDR